MMQTVSKARIFAGTQGFYSHAASSTNCEMQFSVFVPEGSDTFPVIWYLSGLTCTAENATTKAGFQRMAAELGLIVVCPDTSPRGEQVPDDEAYDFGQGAGFYVNATQGPWSEHFHMYDYVVTELPEMIAGNFPADMARQAIMGHSMGGHGALTIAFKNPDRFKSVSAFSPIVSPLNCPWGEKALSGYLGANRGSWADYDACALVGQATGKFDDILVDQGSSDDFLEGQLKPHLFQEACDNVGQKLTLRMQEDYDHSYYFIASFIEDHLRFHMARL